MNIEQRSHKMRAALLATTFTLTSWSCALDVERPNPMTHEWTAKQARAVLPRVDLTETTLARVIELLNDGMARPISIKHELPKEKLNIKVNWKLKNISYLELAAKIADLTDSKLTVEKGFLKLTPN